MTNIKFENDVFMSYEFDVNESIDKLNIKLKENNYKISQNHQVSNAQISDRILSSQIVLCFMTQNYCKSNQCMLEIDFALKCRKDIIFILLENMETDEIGYIMGNSVCLECFKNPNSWWNDDFVSIKSAIDANLNVT